MEAIQIQQQLNEFHGTESYCRHFLASKINILLTDGAEFIRENGKCNWLFDYIAAYQTHKNIKREPFQVWTLQKKGVIWLLSCNDGNKNQLYERKIEFSDFPLERITLFFIDGVAMLPSEY